MKHLDYFVRGFAAALVFVLLVVGIKSLMELATNLLSDEALLLLGGVSLILVLIYLLGRAITVE